MPFITAIAPSASSTLAGLDARYWYGFICYLIALVLVVTQAYISIHPPATATKDATEVKNMIAAAATQTRTAAAKVHAAAVKAQALSDQCTEVENFVSSNDPGNRTITGSPEAHRAFIADLAPKQDEAASAAKDAVAAADEAKDAADKAARDSKTGFLDVANTVASKLPLLGGAFVFAVLGSAVAGLINVSFG